MPVQTKRIFSVLSIWTTRPSWMMIWTTPCRMPTMAAWIAAKGRLSRPESDGSEGGCVSERLSVEPPRDVMVLIMAAIH